MTLLWWVALAAGSPVGSVTADCRIKVRADDTVILVRAT